MPRDFNNEDELARDFVAPHQPSPAIVTDPVLETLVKARALVAKGHVPVAFSIDADGQKNFGCFKEEIMRGEQFCICGALWRVYYEQGEGMAALERMLAAKRLLDAAASAIGHPTAIMMNLVANHEVVLAGFDSAISTRRSEIGE